MIINKKNNQVVAEKYKIISSPILQGLGLMFSRQRNLVFEFAKEQKTGLHMFFVFSPIDVVFLNTDKVVVEIKQNLKPFRCFWPSKKAKYILELKAGSINSSKIDINDGLLF